jgi:hypothetical protein
MILRFEMGFRLQLREFILLSIPPFVSVCLVALLLSFWVDRRCGFFDRTLGVFDLRNPSDGVVDWPNWMCSTFAALF